MPLPRQIGACISMICKAACDHRVKVRGPFQPPSLTDPPPLLPQAMRVEEPGGGLCARLGGLRRVCASHVCVCALLPAPYKGV